MQPALNTTQPRPCACSRRASTSLLLNVRNQNQSLPRAYSSSCSSRASAPLLQTQPRDCQPQRWRQQRQCQTQAAAQDTIVLDEPAVEFLGVLNDGMQTVKGVLHVAADADLVYSILTDYDSCARVFRNIASTETVFTPEGNKQVVQGCKWQFLTFKGTFNVALNVTEEAQDRLLVFRLQESSFMRDFEGRWQVHPAADGGCRIEHVLAVKPLLAIPAAIAPYTSTLFKQQVSALLDDLQQEINRQAAEQALAN